MKCTRKNLKCNICFGHVLGDISDIENPDDRADKLMNFVIILQEITYRKAVIETLRMWRKFKRYEVSKIKT